MDKKYKERKKETKKHKQKIKVTNFPNSVQNDKLQTPLQ